MFKFTADNQLAKIVVAPARRVYSGENFQIERQTQYIIYYWHLAGNPALDNDNNTHEYDISRISRYVRY